MSTVLMSNTQAAIAMAEWDRATFDLANAVADMVAGRDAVAARQRAEAAIAVGTAAIQRWVNYGGTANQVPFVTQQRWVSGMEQFARATNGVTAPGGGSGGLRIGNVIVPWATVAVVAVIVGFGVWWMFFRKGRR